MQNPISDSPPTHNRAGLSRGFQLPIPSYLVYHSPCLRTVRYLSLGDLRWLRGRVETKTLEGEAVEMNSLDVGILFER